MAGHVFVSYSRKDRPYVKQLVEHLRSAGITVWIDETLQPGTPTWVRAVERAIDDCTAFVPVMTPNSSESAWVDREIDLAQELNKPILPLLVEGRRFLRLRDIQTEDVTGGRLPSAAFLAQLGAPAPSVQSGPRAGGGAGSAGSARSGAGSARGGARSGRSLTAELRRTLAGHTAPAVALAWSRDGRFLASGSWDKTVRMWDATAGAIRNSLTGHDANVCSVAWSPDGSRLATGSWDNTARIWDARTATVLHTIDDHAGTVASVAWSPDGRRLATASWDFSVRLWNTDTWDLARTITTDRGVTSMAWSPDGSWLATGAVDGAAVALWAVSGDTRLAAGLSPRPAAVLSQSEPVMSLAWSPDSRRLAVAGSESHCHVWDARAAALTATATGHTKGLTAADWSPDGRWVATASRDQTVRIIDPDTGATHLVVTVSTTPQSLLNRVWAGDANAVQALAWAPDGDRLATASGDGTVRIWSVTDGTPDQATAMR